MPTFHRNLKGALDEATALSLDHVNVEFKVVRRMFDTEGHEFEFEYVYYVGEPEDKLFDLLVFTLWNGLRRPQAPLFIG